MKKYVVIGDIHCRDNWKRLILKDAVHVFVGDYFSPYDNFITLFELACPPVV